MTTKRFAIVVWAFVSLQLTAFSGVAWGDAGKPDEGHNPVMRVGPERTVKTLTQASILARDGTTIEVDAGEYRGDTSIWTQNGISLRSAGGRVRLIADGVSAEGKAIWVVRGGHVSVEGFEFSGARVSDRNGAGIRLESGKLLIKNCKFLDNENGVLTSNNPLVELEIINSEFGHNGHGDGQSHNLYAGTIAKLSISGSYFHHAQVGHLLKSRAAVNDIRYSRFADGADGNASYELEFPNGGIAYVVGNTIEQGPQTQNPHMISFGVEGYRGPRNELYLINNTLVDNMPTGGVFLRVKPGSVMVKAINNLLVGENILDTAGSGEYKNNFMMRKHELNIGVDRSVRIPANQRGKRRTANPGTANGVSLRAQAEYTFPVGTRDVLSTALVPGAMQYSKERMGK